MDHTVFITLAYGATAVLLVGICLASWLRARAVKRQLGESGE